MVSSCSKHVITVDQEHANFRIDKFLSNCLQLSRTKIQEAIAYQLVSVNGCRVKSNYILQPQDIIIASIPIPVDKEGLLPEDIPLHIVYEDDALLVVHKPAEMVVHPDNVHQGGTLAHALAYRYKHLPLRDHKPNRPGLVHRLDKGTSGLLVVAKTEVALARLVQQFADRTVKRTYDALVWGSPDGGTIDLNLDRASYNRQIFSVLLDRNMGKQAITHYQVVQKLHHVTRVTCRLETGRTHQIRVHMKYIGCPLFGDPLYGGRRIVYGEHHASYKAFIGNCFKLMPHQALHAGTLEFQHPVTGQPMHVKAPLPENFTKLIEKWEKYVVARKLG